MRELAIFMLGEQALSLRLSAMQIEALQARVAQLEGEGDSESEGGEKS